MSVTVKRRRITAELRSGEKVVIPGWVVTSGKPGPGFLLVAAQHGNEVQGIEVIRRFVERCKTRLRCGKVFAVPFGNPPAVRNRYPHAGMKSGEPYAKRRRLNMNLFWPGRRNGRVATALPYAIHRAFGDEATHVLDIHCWNKAWAPGVLIPDQPELRDLAGKLGERFVWVSDMGTVTLSGLFCSTGRPGVSYELAGQYTVQPDQVERGLRLTTNMAKAIGIMDGPLEKGDVPVVFNDRCVRHDVKAPRSGLFVGAGLELGAPIKKGDRLGHIVSDVDLRCRPVRCPHTGYLQGMGPWLPDCDVVITGHHPYVTRGHMLAWILSPKRSR